METPAGELLLLACLTAVAVWYACATTITLLSKAWLGDYGFSYPFFATAYENLVCAGLAFLLTRLPALRQPGLPWAVYLRVVVPIGVCTALDVAFGSWSLVYASASFHTMLKATVPAFVLLFGYMLGTEPGSAVTCVSVALMIGGIVLAAADQVDFSVGWEGVAGLVLGVISAILSGLRLALTQLLLKTPRNPPPMGPPQCGTPEGQEPRDVFSARDGGAPPKRELPPCWQPGADKATSGPQWVQAWARGTSDAAKAADVGVEDAAVAEAVASEAARVEEERAEAEGALSRHTSPLSSVLNIAPVIAATDALISLAGEVPSGLLASPWLSTPELAVKLLGALLGVALLVFCLLLAEFFLIRLSSSLTLAVLGVLKEIITIAFAVLLLGDALTVTDVSGFLVCSLGMLIYALSKHEDLAAQAEALSRLPRLPALPSLPRLPRRLSPWGPLKVGEEGASPPEIRG